MSWLTEVFSSDSNAIQRDDFMTESAYNEFGTTSNSATIPSLNREPSSRRKRKNSSSLSFVNVTGPPTKDSRSQARKHATVARKKERKERHHKDGSRTMLAVSPVTTKDRVQSQRSPTSLHNSQISSDITHIPRFGSSRSDPFVKYPLELSHRDRKLMDHSK